MLKSILVRFLKGAVAGAIAQMGLVSINSPQIWADFIPLLNSLGVAATFGAITGILLAGQKFYSWKE